MLSVMDEYLACFVILPKKKKRQKKTNPPRFPNLSF